MALDYDELMSKVQTDLPFSYTDADTMLYALSIGMGTDPLNLRELPYVYEQGEPLKTIPTLATVLVPEMFPVGLGWDYSQILHSEQRMRLYRPLPPAADLLINKRVVDAFDRGPKLGALILLEAEGRLASDDTVLFTMGSSAFIQLVLNKDNDASIVMDHTSASINARANGQNGTPVEPPLDLANSRFIALQESGGSLMIHASPTGDPGDFTLLGTIGVPFPLNAVKVLLAVGGGEADATAAATYELQPAE